MTAGRQTTRCPVHYCGRLLDDGEDCDHRHPLRPAGREASDDDRLVSPGEEGYDDAFDMCPEPTCPLYGKAVMADHRHLAGRKATPGACADPSCPVLHADQANPIHPPSYEPGGPFMDDPCPECFPWRPDARVRYRCEAHR